ncbi:cation-translocating P-type ATPase [Plantibacter sp. VKM Ac-2876]|uniref:heavy metal translocating P-type ATPase n=1 Tax=Plantibacter sp. VKM Ac-2876 TaxID=2783826 RepID=UPI00188BCC49|nr:heavy metal translocating P-type ATPase [Plantibacter sp. VKM Ac-2876]MBF4566781.1 copper-translocating P-type ATPase [Plantibacter sp. VKM Ac-2876]
MSAPLIQLDLDIEGMTCASCVARVEKRLTALDGVEAQVNLATERATVTAPSTVTADELVAAVAKAGYTATVRPPADERAAADREQTPTSGPTSDPSATVTTLRTRLVVSAVLALPVVLLAMIPAWQFDHWQWLSLTLATPVVFWGGYPFHRATFATLRHGSVTMDTLITLGTGAAYLWSVWALFFGMAGMTGMRHEFTFFAPDADPSSALYLEVAAGVTVFLLAGRLIEQRSKRAAGEALRDLMTLGASEVSVLRHRAPDPADLMAPTRTEERIPIEQLLVGDHFLVRPGESVATDGVVVEGAASVDESLVTGESVPVELVAGSRVIGGTIARGGSLVVRATAVGAETQLARMAQAVEAAQLGKSRVQRLADRVSSVFVPVVLVIALGTATVWALTGSSMEAAFTAAVAVLIIACPCALGLATPVALLVGTGRGAQLGILIAGPEALERASNIDRILLDKTGTVTSGRMSVTEVWAAGATDEVLALGAALEAASEHPIAEAIVAEAARRDAARPVVSDFASLEGLGVTGTINGGTVLAGRPAFAEDQGFRIGPDAASALASAAERASTVVVVAWDGEVRGVVEVADTVKPEARAAIGRAVSLGMTPVLLTGDNAAVAARVAAEVGITEVIADASPADKVAAVERLQTAGHRVAMIGDGVNDAAAIATADLGIAMGTGTDAAKGAADLSIVSGSLATAIDAVRLSRRTLGIIRGNLFWAFAYNVAAIPLAALGLLNPMIAGAAMAFSSVFVVLNSLRLRRFRPAA